MVKLSIILMMWFSQQATHETQVGYIAAFTEPLFDQAVDCIINEDQECVKELLSARTVIKLPKGLRIFILEEKGDKFLTQVAGTDIKLWMNKEALTIL